MLPPSFLIILLTILQLKNQMIYSCYHNTSCGCSDKSRLHSKIVGGLSAKIRTWGWVVSLRVRDRFRCAGSILSNSWILTAAHCFSLISESGGEIIQTDPSEITVHAGSVKINDEHQIRRVVNMIIHPKFDPSNFINDIALLKLSSSLDMIDVNLANICLPNISVDVYPPLNSLLVAVGWGRLWEKGPASPILQQVILKAIDYYNDTCYPMVSDQSKQFCAGVENSIKDTCQGDSGGPLMMFTSSNQWVITGVTSFGYGCAQSGYSGVYTRVSTYLNWMNSMINNTDNSIYPHSLIYNTPFDDDNIEWRTNHCFRHSMSLFLSILISSLTMIMIYSVT